MDEVLTTLVERNILRHALGLTRPGVKIPYRNYFYTEAGCNNYATVLGLVEKGLMSGSKYEDTFFVTRKGAIEIGLSEEVARYHCLS